MLWRIPAGRRTGSYFFQSLTITSSSPPGIQYNYFGHDEWRRVAPGLESLDDADLIRGKILLAFERAEEMAALDHADTERIRQRPAIAPQ
jgi:hypothetical protein